MSNKTKPTCEFCGTEKRLDYELGGWCCPNYCTFKAAGKTVADLVGPPRGARDFRAER